jgi:hypothetical protein
MGFCFPSKVKAGQVPAGLLRQQVGDCAQLPLSSDSLSCFGELSDCFEAMDAFRDCIVPISLKPLSFTCL